MCITKPKSILIVDDEVHIAYFIADVLNDEGYETRMCHNGDCALKSIDQEKPALMLLDINMPVLAGDKVLGHLGPASQRGFPVIVMTAALSSHNYLNAGADVVLPKPFEIEQLLKYVESLTAVKA